MKIKDYYKILGVERTASTEDIKEAYRRLVRMFHPDFNKDPESLRLFYSITEAYQVLGNLENRLDYSLILFEQDLIKEQAKRILKQRKKKQNGDDEDNDLPVYF
ncbi:MAG TPA: DnaJ domain-containing protein [Bacteroidota bacterium]|mgnify:FL=1|nr:DnaJ domain-containing protein [Candidatus Kapabacteria bacterium]HRS01741.1 DnaJ domain-containing protein [Bacteroidota bacterium]HRT67923.1 DnaJ domain-containing protein [Bacteroidota bacterium]